jgi:RimJ/RimL family protein N-acetyltransferase
VRIEPVELRAGPYRLRPAAEADVDAALGMSMDPLVQQWNPTGVVDREAARGWLLRSSDWSGGDHATWVVADAEDRLVGNFSIGRIDTGDQLTALMSYRTAPWARNRGVAGFALFAATRWAVDVVRLERLELVHAVANPASCRVAERAGYLLEGLSRKGYRDTAGRRWDSHLHGRLAGDPEPGS